MRHIRPLTLLWLLLAPPAFAHDIPNARVDRSIQATVRPGRLAIDYEVSLSELTLTQDLRSLIGTLPGGDREAWFDRYGRETGPLNAKGMLVTVDGTPVELRADRFDLAVEDHPRFTFHFDAELPERGRLLIHDTNFAASEGTSRLAVQGREGVKIRGDDLPGDVEQIPVRPAWQLSDSEERRTKQVAVEYAAATVREAPSVSPAPASPVPPPRAPRAEPNRLSRLLDRSTGLHWAVLGLIAFAMGAAHALQPGHGKTLVAATVVGEGGTWLRGALLALVTTLTHTGSVLLVAVGLWSSRSSQYAEIHQGLARAAGFLIAAIGLWRIGRHLAGFGEHDGADGELERPAGGGIVGLGIAGGLVPCWDAIALILLAEAVGRLALGVALLITFGLGMASVLVAVGWLAARVRRLAARSGRLDAWERPLGIAGGLALAVIGVYLLGAF